MKKHLSAWSLLWISLTSMIGSGWLFGSLYSAHFAGPAAIIAWPLAGFLLLFVALPYAEIATMFPHANSLALLPLYTHGRLTSMIMNGLAWISLATIPVIETQGIIQYASNYLPHVIKHDGIHYATTARGYFLALLLLFSFVIFNYFGIRLFARINTIFTLWKMFVPGLTVIALLITSYHANNFFAHGGFMPYGWQGIMAAMSSGGVLFSLLGFRQVVIMVGEAKNPKCIPLVLIGSLILTTILYTGLQWSFISSLRAQDRVNGWANLSFPGDAGPFAALATIVGLIGLSILLYVDAIISPYSTALAYSTTAAQMLASMAKTGSAPANFAKKNKYHVPITSLGIDFVLAALMFFLLRNWQAMSAFLVAVMMITYAIGPVCLICLRQQIPLHPRPFRLYYANIISFLGFYICTAGVYWTGFYSILKLIVLIVLSLGIYVCYCYFLKKKLLNFDNKHAGWLLCYLFGLGVFSYFGNYDGNHFIPQYYDLIYLFGFSLIIFYHAYYSRKPNKYTQELLG